MRTNIRNFKKTIQLESKMELTIRNQEKHQKLKLTSKFEIERNITNRSWHANYNSELKGKFDFGIGRKIHNTRKYYEHLKSKFIRY